MWKIIRSEITEIGVILRWFRIIVIGKRIDRERMRQGWTYDFNR